MAAGCDQTAKGEAQLNSELESDFRNHQQMLLALLQERKDATDGSRNALELDRQIGKVESVVRSYQTVKWYEQQVREKPRMQTRDPGTCDRLQILMGRTPVGVSPNIGPLQQAEVQPTGNYPIPDTNEQVLSACAGGRLTS
jgi:hypothetical protein